MAKNTKAAAPTPKTEVTDRVEVPTKALKGAKRDTSVRVHTVFVGNLDYRTKIDTLRKFFETKAGRNCLMRPLPPY